MSDKIINNENLYEKSSRGMYFIALNLEKFNEADQFLNSVRYINDERAKKDLPPIGVDMAKLALTQFYYKKPYIYNAVLSENIDKFKELTEMQKDNPNLKEGFYQEQSWVGEETRVTDKDFEKFIKSLDEELGL